MEASLINFKMIFFILEINNFIINNITYVFKNISDKLILKLFFNIKSFYKYKNVIKYISLNNKKIFLIL